MEAGTTAPPMAPGLAALMSEGFTLQDAPAPKTIVVGGLRIFGVLEKTRTIGQQLLRASRPDRLIAGLIEQHTVNGYTSHAALCETLEQNLKALHREARKDMPDNEHAWLTVDGMHFAVQFDEDADAWPRGGLANVWVAGQWHYPRDVLAPKLCEQLDEAAAKWRPES